MYFFKGEKPKNSFAMPVSNFDHKRMITITDMSTLAVVAVSAQKADSSNSYRLNPVYT